ncbi:tRNA-guanine transglycosylase DpdA [Methanoculleus horonobensis]|uniref:tRNA-guanine transglycosylase DpdA n=1 Tax=Methanoculleus horonobensis TaxID=528314 RepID=UPI0008308874|nr:tRNA-guanine transglycosylase DpdA [Methanoculleus horonobensis]NLE26539.1 hypothetical protein [Clostridiaceae bacterium]
MRYFIPEWDDRVDPGFDFIRDQHSQAHKEDALNNDTYMWDIFGIENVPFDGVLVSIATIQEKKSKYAKILENGIHRFFGLPQNFEIMADCGAFSYIDEPVPLYSTSEALQLYSDLGFNYGVSVDHLVVPMYRDQNGERMRITYNNGLAAFEEWSRKYRNDFQLIVAVQGETVSDYLTMYNDFIRHGISHLAFGGLVRSPTIFLIELLDALIDEIRDAKIRPEYLHFFGLARCDLFSRFQQLEEFGIRVAFDSASYLRKAWLSSASTQLNYITPDWKGYSAIRIPEKLKGKKKDLVQQPVLDMVGQECLRALRRYDQGSIDIEDVLKPLTRFNSAIQEKPRVLEYYRRVLEEKPWKACPCPICREHGIEVIIFRGNNRNRRRGFHNTWAFHQILRDPSLWTNCIKKKRPDDAFQYVESLDFLQKGDNVLVITGCTKKKLDSLGNVTAPAKEMYQGMVFRKVREYAESMGFDYAIISAKYGLLFPDDMIEGYEQVLRSKADIKSLQPAVEDRLGEIIDQYDQIMVIAGMTYRMVLENIWDDRFVFLKARGIGDLCSIVAHSIPLRDRSLDEFVSSS